MKCAAHRSSPAERRVAVARPSARRQVVLSSLAFIVGFSLVFISLGAAASAIGQFLAQRQAIFNRIAGAVIIIFGLHTMGVLRIEWLYQEKRVQTSRKPAGFLGAGLVGVAFAFGWTPCIGPILAGILAIAGSQETVGQGVRLLAVYSLGLGVPFLATALMIDRFFAAMGRIRRYYHTIETRVRRAPGRHRPADLHEQVHRDRQVAHAVFARLLRGSAKGGTTSASTTYRRVTHRLSCDAACSTAVRGSRFCV